MNKYSIRFNKSRGQPGRGSEEHVWRVFENDEKEYLFKNLNIMTGVTNEKDKNGNDYNIVCFGKLSINRETSTAIISEVEAKTERKCDECTQCCTWMDATTYGHSFGHGKSCFYLQKNCTIYETRPVNACQTYKCHWLASDDLPMWMRPDLCNAIVTPRKQKGFEYFDVTECGKTLSTQMLSWMVEWALNKGKNIQYVLDGKATKIGSKEFIAAQL